MAGAGPARSCTGHMAGISVAGCRDLGFALRRAAWGGFG